MLAPQYQLEPLERSAYVVIRLAVVKALGGIEEAAFAEYILGWQSSVQRPVFKTAAEIEAELGLKRRAQERVRASLLGLGVLEEHRAGEKGTMHYLVNAARVRELCAPQNVQNVQTGMSETYNRRMYKTDNLSIQRSTRQRSTSTKESAATATPPRKESKQEPKKPDTLHEKRVAIIERFQAAYSRYAPGQKLTIGPKEAGTIGLLLKRGYDLAEIDARLAELARRQESERGASRYFRDTPPTPAQILARWNELVAPGGQVTDAEITNWIMANPGRSLEEFYASRR